MTDIDYEDTLIVETFIHEAGHALAAHRLGFRVDGIIVNGAAGDGEQLGRVDIGNLDNSRDAAIVYAAGEAASQKRSDDVRAHNSANRWKGGPLHRLAQWPGMSTEDKAGVNRYLMANYFGGPSAKSEVSDIRREARRLVNDEWETIRKVTKSLNDRSIADGSAKLDRAGFLTAIGEK